MSVSIWQLVEVSNMTVLLFVGGIALLALIIVFGLWGLLFDILLAIFGGSSNSSGGSSGGSGFGGGNSGGGGANNDF